MMGPVLVGELIKIDLIIIYKVGELFNKIGETQVLFPKANPGLNIFRKINLCETSQDNNAAMMKRVLSSSAYDRNVININLQRTEQHCNITSEHLRYPVASLF